MIRWGYRGFLTAAVAWLLVAFPGSLLAQSRPNPLCLRPHRAPACSGYLIFEVRGGGHVWHTERLVRTEAPAVPGDPPLEAFSVTSERTDMGDGFDWDLGYAVNVDDDWSVGATFSSDLIDGRRHEARVHIRRWLKDALSVELAPGAFKLEGREGLGYSLGARVLLWELALEARYAVLDVPASVTIRDRIGGRGTITVTDPGGLEHGFSVGAGLQHVSGVVGSLVLIVLAGAAAAR